MYSFFKSCHLIFVVTWFAGLFYMGRLLIYHVEANERPETEKLILQKQYSVMEKRLWTIITWPSSVLALCFGMGLLSFYLPLGAHPWLLLKLFFVLLLILYQLKTGQYYQQLQKNSDTLTAKYLRYWNEIPTLLLTTIIFLVVFKTLDIVWQGLVGLLILGILISVSIKLYKR
jgi:putative membrane protein